MKKTIVRWGISVACIAVPFVSNAQKTEPVFEITAGNAVNNAKF